MYHFFAQHENIHDTYIDITGDDVNHVKNVLRMKTGDELLISSGSNVDYYCHISEMTDDNIRAEIDSIDEEGLIFMAEFITHGLVGIISKWVKSGMPLTPEQLHSRIIHLVDDGIKMVFLSYISKINL